MSYKLSPEQVADRLRKFDVVWIGLASEGKCDSLGGAEWKRISGLWMDAGMATGGLRAFIITAANIGSDGKGVERAN